MNDINSKPTPILMRELLKRCRGNYVFEENKEKNRDLSVRDLLKITRSLNENEEKVVNNATPKDFEIEKDVADGFFDGMGYRLKGENDKPYLIIANDFVKLGGVVNGVVRFIFTVRQDKNNSGIEFEYTDDFTPENPENDEIIKKIETYYNNFYDRMVERLNEE